MGALIIGIFFMIIGWMVSARLKRKFREYSQIHLTRNLTGAEIARLMLADNGLSDVQVISVEGQLTDHYNPSNRTVNLSQDVYHGRNAAAAAVAAHECGHAVQHAKAYSMLEFRFRDGSRSKHQFTGDQLHFHDYDVRIIFRTGNFTLDNGSSYYHCLLRCLHIVRLCDPSR